MRHRLPLLRSILGRLDSRRYDHFLVASMHGSKLDIPSSAPPDGVGCVAAERPRGARQPRSERCAPASCPTTTAQPMGIRATLGQTCTQLHCARFQSARARTCRHTRRSFNSTDREAIVRQQRRRRFIPAFSFPGLDSIPGVILAKHRPKFPTALRGLLAKPLLKQDR